ncbi:hypothetical protein RHMOL_Rhmol05G0006900 [Rhododendron molle]|uniref:Uncharacterized protein n=1 Tax=Rhododendron molle TaxID=49168 RepID=A0ACC0NJG0_RHOML|nr:hypothetical protein RHMOL_Rhmol05G0006900 [Rhododendron molle]
MAGSSSGVPSLPPPRPKSPPEYPDLYGKRRELAKVQMLEREIGFLEGELKFVESLPPASRCCKEYVIALAVVSYCTEWLLISRWQIRILLFLRKNVLNNLFFLEFSWRLLFNILLCLPEVGRFVDLVDSGNGSVEHPVLTSHGCAVLGAPLILKCQAAAAIAAYVTVIHALIVQCQNVGVAPGLARDALTRSHAAAASVALPGVFHAQIAIVDVVALVLNAQS